MRQVVYMANAEGGIIVIGVDENLSILGIQGDCNQDIMKLENAIRKLSIGITAKANYEVIEGHVIIILEIEKAESTAYFTRVDTSPARQIAYHYKKVEGKGTLLKEDLRYTKVFKYMTVDAFLTSLYRKKWRFFEPSKWNDKYEQRFYCATYSQPNATGNTPQLFATCITREKNSEAAWKVYAHGQGLSAHCVQLELDIIKLREQLRKSGNRFEERPIVYKNEHFIMELHHKKHPKYKEYFDTFTLDSFLRLLSLKRDAYTYEQEVRLFLIPQGNNPRNSSKKAQCIDIDINWRDVIKRVRVDNNCTDAELRSIQSACFTVGINPFIKNYTFIGNGNPPTNLNNIEFEKFDIDAMPGKTKIRIK